MTSIDSLERSLAALRKSAALLISREYEAEMQELWENDPRATSVVLATRFHVTRMVVCGLAFRRGWHRHATVIRSDGGHWNPPVPEGPTLHTRLDALHKKMDSVLKECEGVGRIPLP